MSTAWTKATKILATTALAALGALSIGCGPAPGYEESAPPRVPVGYTSVNGPEPATSEELAARAQAAQQAQLEGNDPQAAAAQPGNGDIVVGADNTEYTDTDPSALNEFKPALDGHGQWVDDSTYGTVWVPNEAEVGTDFVPYTTAGHWTYADDTNYVWVSDYSWGWAPFHYGRWAHVGPRGWVWIPGRTYAGAWVTWRYGAGYDYVGWAPAGPEWYWYNGYAVGWGWGWSPYYSYCHHDHFYDHRVGGYIVRGHDYESHTRPYVGGSSGPGGRVAANPTVGGSAGAGGRVAATPTVGGPRTAAMARVAGPSPAEMGIQKSSIVAPPSDNAGLARAHALATPATAVAHGAAPPATAIRRRVDHNDAIVSAPGAHGAGGVGGPDGRSPAVASRFEPAARAPQVQGVSPAPYRAPSATSSSMAASHSFAGNGASAPAYRSSPSFASSPSSPSYRSAPSFSAPSYRSAPSQSSPSFHSAPSVSHSSAPSPHVSAPSAPRPSSRSSGGSRGGRR